jgi:hypothetical protein
MNIGVEFELRSFTPDVEFRGIVLDDSFTITLIRIDVHRIEE